MAYPTWSPESLGMPNRQNYLLWNDMERAYQFVEENARFSISGNLEGFLFELVRRRWNLACADSYQPPPETGGHFWDQSSNFLATAPAGLSLANLDRISLPRLDIDRFHKYAAEISISTEPEPFGKLFGYGADGYGTYIPLHLLWPKLKKYWGIYISESGVFDLAARIYRDIGPFSLSKYSDLEIDSIKYLFQIAYQVLLRHQLFHFKLEQWALLFELATGRSVYLPYLEYVYLPTIYDPADRNLEEALANLSILLSKKIQRLESKSGIIVLQYLPRIFLHLQGPSYRNFALTTGLPEFIEWYDREERYRQVVNYLCNQVIQHELNPVPLVPYYLYPPNNNFLRAENLCPIYLIRNMPYEVEVIS